MSGSAGMNFGETIAYWYFRLNGFFPLTNFVHHRIQDRKSQRGGLLAEGRKYNADADLLAVRFPHVYEEIGGRDDDWDDERFSDWKIRIRAQRVAIICQVKTGSYQKTSINNAFSEIRLRESIRRIGIMPSSEADKVANRLYEEEVVEKGDIVFAKVLMAWKHAHSEGWPSKDTENGVQMHPCCKIHLDDAITFIEGRMEKYAEPKKAGRMFFPSELIQYIAWSKGIKLLEYADECEGD